MISSFKLLSKIDRIKRLAKKNEKKILKLEMMLNKLDVKKRYIKKLTLN